MTRRGYSLLGPVCSVLALTTLICAPLASQELLDGNEDFALIANDGFQEVVDGSWPTLVPNPLGSARNSYPWSIAEFQGKVYVGLIRDVFCFLTDPALRPEECPPADEGEFPIPTADQAAEIWEYTPSVEDGGINGTWRQAFVSPSAPFPVSLLFPGAPRDVGYRGMEVCDAGDATERLYIASIGIPGYLHYTENGSEFSLASSLGLEADVTLLSLLTLDFDLGYRPIECFRGRLWTSPVGTTEDTDLSNNPVVLANADPSDPSSPWVATSAPGFGDSDNLSVFDLGTFDADNDGEDDFLYAGTFNRTTGAEIWRTDGLIGGDCDATTGLCAWTKVLDEGGGRPMPDAVLDNAGATAFADLDGYLYVGLADAASNSPTLAEMVRFRGSDGMFELVMGEIRDSTAPIFNWDSTACHPLSAIWGPTACVPLSYRGAGFGPQGIPVLGGGAVYLWRMTTFEDEVYAGTLQFGPVFGPEFNPPGFDLLKSSDGESWDFVSTDGLGDTSNGGLRTFLPTDEALYVGGTNSREGFVVFLGTTVPERPPVAIPGADQILFDDASTGVPGDDVVDAALDGSASFDPFGGTIVAWEWYEGDLTGSCLIGGATPINSGTTDVPLFLEALAATSGDPLTDPFITHVRTLRVEDDIGQEDCAAVTIVASANLPPTAEIAAPVGAAPAEGGDPRTLHLVDFDGDGEAVISLQGFCEDPEADLASCTWTVADGALLSPSPPALSTSATVIVAELAESLYGDPSPNLVLTAADNVPWQGSDSVQIRVAAFSDGPDNDRPACRSGEVAVLRGEFLTFDPADPSIPRTYLCDDPDGDGLTYTAGPPIYNGDGTTSDGATVTYDTVVGGFDGPDLFTLGAEDPSMASSETVGVAVRVVDCSLSVIDLSVSGESLSGNPESREACLAVLADASTVEAGANVTFRAGEVIVLGNGFGVTETGVFSAEIDGSLLTPP